MTNEQNKKGLFVKTESLLGWVSALFGCVFLILNLIVFSCVVPQNRNNKEFAVNAVTKRGQDGYNYVFRFKGLPKRFY